MDGLQQQLDEERYAADLTAIAECVAKGVSERAVLQLASECAIDRRDLEPILRLKRSAA